MNTRISHRILSAALAGVLCLAAPTALASEFATVKGGGLNLRQTASLDAKVLGQYGTGTWIEVVKKGDTWSQVKVNGQQGYMMTKYLNFGLNGNTLYVRTNTGIGLNLREAPNLCAKIITSFPVNTAVQVIQAGDSGLMPFTTSCFIAPASITVSPPCEWPQRYRSVTKSSARA